ncbi:MAG: thiamine pyrophosphate-dependent enzyme [Candidatus Binatia bacterium]|nr:thiamine pyrophosphate-dependent enzyme [Candidatus Binatia bacterium]
MTILTTKDAVEAAMPALDGYAVVCANGFISRWACSVKDRPSHFYMIGSMGLASSIGLGIALAQPEQPVAVLDGDGNVLMNLGQLPMIAASKPKRFFHFVIDNGVYASTGNQPTISRSVALEKIAAASGYARAARVSDRASLDQKVAEFVGADGPSLLLVETVPESGPPAPRIPYTPEEMTARMRGALGGGA